MDTYGDMVTLLLCFFVLLYAFSDISAAKWQALVGSFTGRTVVDLTIIDPNTPVYQDISPLPRADESDDYEETEKSEVFDKLYTELQQYIQENELEATLDAKKEGGAILLRFSDNILFASGSAELRSTGRPILDGLADILRQNIAAVKLVRIEGHTDNVPIHNAFFDDNWDLSVARAMTVLYYYLSNSELSPDKLSAAGYGEYHPVDTNDTENGRSNNRRVDFIIEEMNTEQTW
jgi:chemotaxis protein MotB